MFNIELSLEEMQELDVTLFLRIDQLRQEQSSPNAKIAQIAKRQTQRLVPVYMQVRSALAIHQNAGLAQAFEGVPT